MKKNIKKSIFSVVLASAITAGSLVPVYATDTILYNIDKKVKYSSDQLQKAEILRRIEEEVAKSNKFAKSIGGKLVNYEEYEKEAIKKINEYRKDENKDFTEAVKAFISNDIEDVINKLEKVETEEAELRVESVSAINPTTVKVTFNGEVEELVKADVVVTNTKTSEKQYIKSVKLAEDKKSAEVEFYNPLVTKNTYKVVIDEMEKEFDYVVADVAKIEAKTVQTVKAAEATAIEYKVLDENGLDITADTDVTFESTTELDKGKITLADKQTAFVYVVYTDKDGNKIKSDRITVKAEEAKPAEIADYTVGKNVDFDADHYKQNLILQKGAKEQKVHVLVKDQFGKEDNTDVNYESLDKSIALVDRNSGAITPLKEGSVPVKLTVGDLTKTIEIKVVADAKATAIELDKNKVSVSNQVTSPEKVKVTVKDQYDNAFETAGKLTVKVTTGSDLVTVAKELTPNKGVAILDVKAADKTKAGKAVIEISVNAEVKATLEVDVTAAGIVDGYVVEGFKAELDKKNDDKNTDKDMTLAVYPVDADGSKTGDKVTDAKMTVTDKDGTAVTGLKDVAVGEIATTNLKTDETYTVLVKVGSIEVFKDSFKVVDTTKEAVIEQKTSNINIEIADGKINDELKAAFLIGGEALSGLQSVVVKSSDNAGVVAVNETGEAIAIKNGKATLVIEKVAGVKVDNLLVNVTIDAIKGKLDGGAKIKTVNITKNADDILTAPNGSYSVEFGIVGIKNGSTEDFKQLESLKVELKNEDAVIATNILQPENITNGYYAGSPFNIGSKTVNDKWSWNRGVWSGSNDLVPTKATITYETEGIKYVVDVDVDEDGLTAPIEDGINKYAAIDVEVAQYIVDTFAKESNQSDIQTGLIAKDDKYSEYTITVSEDIVTIKNGDDLVVVGKVILRK